MTPDQIQVAVAQVISPSFLVGGSVRDALMERPVSDFDFATPLPVEEVEAAIRAAGRKPYLVGKRFGTIGMRIEGVPVEITSFDGTLEDDLARREFTINAMALDGPVLIDPFDGRADLDARVVRGTRDAVRRFDEDPVRILRAARFASQLDFVVESETAEAMGLLAHRILDVARERWATELDKLLVGPGAGAALRLLAETGVLRYVLPEVHLEVATTLFSATVTEVDSTPPEVERRWATLLRDTGAAFVATGESPARSNAEASALISAQLAERIGLYLKWSNARRAAVQALLLRTRA